jgi:hypothetical protein
MRYDIDGNVQSNLRCQESVILRKLRTGILEGYREAVPLDGGRGEEQ